jgi:predicted nucleic acid-binding protein
VTSRILEYAASLVSAYALRAYDSVQLATGLTARAVVSDCDTFLCFDRGLSKAAAAEGFRLLDV